MRLYELARYNSSKLPAHRQLHNWSVSLEQDVLDSDLVFHKITHHGTQMLTWLSPPDDPCKVLTASGWLGWGSVSDQNGMNEFLAQLDIPVYYSRIKGAHFIAHEQDKDFPEVIIVNFGGFSYQPSLKVG